MMDLPNLVILDVGHGSCAVLQDTRGVTIFDGSRGGILLDFLEQQNIKEVQSVLISHGHKDHIEGVVTLLLAEDILVREVYLNPDAKRDTDIWWRLRRAVADARKNKKPTRTHTELNTSLNGCFDHGLINIEVLAPTPELAMSGVSGQDMSNRPLSPHAMSAVLRLKKGGLGAVLIPGDVEGLGIENLLADHPDISACVLIFPHHGGRSYPSKMPDFARRLCQTVKPECVIFSIGRGVHGTPREEVVEAIRSVLPTTRILCTQLSDLCASKIPDIPPDHLNDIPAAGRLNNSCCAGSIIIDLSKSKLQVKPEEKGHIAFCRIAAPTSLCLKV